MTVPLVISLAELRSPLEKNYRNAYYCTATLLQDADGRLRGKYCGTRWCLVCNRARTARAIGRYGPILEGWPDAQFVTLTLPNVPAALLPTTIDEMLRNVSAIGRAIKRTDKLPFQALRKLECTYSPVRDDFHPHFHLIVKSKDAAKAVVRRWLARYSTASPDAQDIRSCNAGMVKELFKYFTKLTTERSDSTSSRTIAPVSALDLIFQAMVGRRVYQPMGFKTTVAASTDENAMVGETCTTITPKRMGDILTWEWFQQAHDWIDRETGEALSGFALDPKTG